VKERRATLEALAARSGEQTVSYLSKSFARQGWIARDAARP
jgi:hypothetical protein